jgi:hypothetical protein
VTALLLLMLLLMMLLPTAVPSRAAACTIHSHVLFDFSSASYLSEQINGAFIVRR